MRKEVTYCDVCHDERPPGVTHSTIQGFRDITCDFSLQDVCPDCYAELQSTIYERAKYIRKRDAL